MYVNHFVDRVRKTRTVVGFGPVHETQSGFKKSTSDFEEVSAVGCWVCGEHSEELSQVEDDLRWDEEPWRLEHGERHYNQNMGGGSTQNWHSLDSQS